MTYYDLSYIMRREVSEDDAGPLTMTVPAAGKKLGLSRNAAYEAAARGDLPTIRIGSRLFVPVRALDALLDSATDRWRRREVETAA
jgi:hypothetical protein